MKRLKKNPWLPIVVAVQMIWEKKKYPSDMNQGSGVSI